MESMYDKLGELLSGALDSGFIPNEEKKSAKEEEPKTQEQNQNHKEEQVKRKIPENVRNALAQIKIPENASFEDAKKIYREKLKLYHPDTKNDNPVLQKVAKEKTENLLSSWKIIEEYFKSQKLK